ncbi:hypothetical protein AT268_30445 [Bacillus cereus]|uniref:Uncharacterized protein n=1 Tax=Bacillus cereus TaxID=1396 RepID=A0A9X0MEU7_BACCE|nr:hypothetical protein AT268_30445 [Bacillus cereus]
MIGFQIFLFRQAEKRVLLDEVLGKSIRCCGVNVTDSNIIQSSDIYELLQYMGNQMSLADIVVEDEPRNEIKDAIAFRILKNPMIS